MESHDLLEPHWQGAEAKVYIETFGSQQAIYKQRFTKEYRHPFLDQRLNSRRITQEARCLAKAFKCGVPTPTVYFVDPNRGLLVMELINGDTCKQAIINGIESLEKLGKDIGTIIAKLHSNDIIHGDLTTSNILLREGLPVLIDFGLSSVSNSIEDRAVDLYVLERAISSTHPEIESDLFNTIIQEYGIHVTNSKNTLAKLAAVQLRGRKRDMSG